MSTHTYPTEDARRLDQTDRTTTPTYQPTIDRGEEPAHPDDSWVARCQSQFDATRTDCLPNLVDDANQAMPSIR